MPAVKIEFVKSEFCKKLSNQSVYAQENCFLLRFLTKGELSASQGLLELKGGAFLFAQGCLGFVLVSSVLQSLTETCISAESGPASLIKSP